MKSLWQARHHARLATVFGFSLVPQFAAGVVPAVTQPFDATHCVELRSNIAPQATDYIFLNRCPAPIALLIVVCDLRAQPACRTDSLYSRGWTARGGIEYLRAPALTEGLRTAAWQRPNPGIRRGFRAQIAACTLGRASAPPDADPCVARLTALKRRLDASEGKSIDAVLRERHP